MLRQVAIEYESDVKASSEKSKGLPVCVGLAEAEGGHERCPRFHGHADKASALLQKHHLHRHSRQALIQPLGRV